MLHKKRKTLPRNDHRANARVNPSRKAMPKMGSNAASNRLHGSRKAMPKGKRQTGVKVENARFGKRAAGIEANRRRRKGPMDRPSKAAKRAKPIPSEKRSPPGHRGGQVKGYREKMYEAMRADH